MTTPPNWQQKFAKFHPSAMEEGEGVQTLVLVRGKDMQGAAQWAYALIPADNYLPFRLAESEGAYRLADFGQVLHYGAGENPPEDITRQMAEEYGANAHFEEELREMIEQALEEASKQ